MSLTAVFAVGAVACLVLGVLNAVLAYRCAQDVVNAPAADRHPTPSPWVRHRTRDAWTHLALGALAAVGALVLAVLGVSA